MELRLRSSFLGLGLYSVALSFCLAQVAVPEPPALTVVQPVQSGTYQALLNSFLASQQGLAQQMQALIQQGATSPQLQNWTQKNATLLQAQQQRAQALAASAPVQPIAYITDVEIPDDATPEMTDFLVAQANLANDFAELHNQQAQSGTSATTDLVALLQKKDAAAIQAQQQLAQDLAAQSDQQPQQLPPPQAIPDGSTPQMQAYLTLRDQLMREQVQLHNTYTTSSPAARATALTQWLQQNASRFQHLQQLAQNLSSPTPN